MNLFFKAMKNGYRFKTQSGLVTTEDLFSLPLTSSRGLSLDSVARLIYDEIKQSEEISFVSIVSTNSTELEEKLTIVKEIIADRLADNLAKTEAKEKEFQRQRLKELRANKILEKESELSLEEIDAKLASL